MPAARNGLKICNRCRRIGKHRHEWPVHMFFRDASRSDGLSANCRTCQSQANSDYIANRMSLRSKAARASYAKALVAISAAHPDEFAAIKRRLMRVEEKLPDRRGFHGRGRTWTDEQRYPEPGRKRCRSCRRVKPMTHDYFFRDGTKSRDGYAHRCRICVTKANKESDRHSDTVHSRVAAQARGVLRDRHRDQFDRIRQSIMLDILGSDAIVPDGSDD